MTVWVLKSGRIDAFAPLVSTTADRARALLLVANGKPKSWDVPPAVEFLVEKRAKKQLPRADVPVIMPGALALTGKAMDALGEFLSPFGQLLPLDCHEEPIWYFNVTNVIDCLDKAASSVREDGSIAVEAFHRDLVPVAAAVFKDPAKLRSRIFINQAGKEAIERILATTGGLTGLEIGELGSD